MFKSNYYDRYYVSDKGRVFDTEKQKEVPIWKNRLGYCYVSLFIEGKQRIKKVHLLVAQIYLFNPNPLQYNQINHKDGNKENNNVLNLEWCDSYINNKHAREHNLNDISSSNKNRWLNAEFSKKTRKKMQEAAKNRDYNGKKNPNFKYLLQENDICYTLKEFSEKYNLTYMKVYNKMSKAIREGLNYFYFEEKLIYILQG